MARVKQAPLNTRSTYRPADVTPNFSWRAAEIELKNKLDCALLYSLCLSNENLLALFFVALQPRHGYVCDSTCCNVSHVFIPARSISIVVFIPARSISIVPLDVKNCT
jgi:hypothetical protein